MDNRYFRKAVYYETDQMGIVHHSNYIRYFEEARVFFMHNIGCDVKELEELGVIIPNVDAYAKYLKPIKFYDDFYVEVKLVSFTGVRMEFDFVIKLCETDEIACTGHTTHCFVNKSFKPMSIKKSFPDYYAKFIDNIDKNTNK